MEKEAGRSLNCFFDAIASGDEAFRAGVFSRTRVVLSTHFSGYGDNTDAQFAGLSEVARLPT